MPDSPEGRRRMSTSYNWPMGMRVSSDVDHALAQAGCRTRALSMLRSPSVAPHRDGVVDKHQVEIRAIAQLDTAQLAVAENRKAGAAATRARGCPYLLVRSAQATASTCSRITSAIQVSLSLTCISGRRPASSLAAHPQHMGEP